MKRQRATVYHQGRQIAAYPLSWPLGWPRTRDSERRYGQFRRRDTSWQERITVHQAIGRIMEQIRAFTRLGRTFRIDPDDVVISTNIPARQDGLPRSDARKPDDPGVAVYFELDGRPQVIAIDTYTGVEQNLAAVAAVLDAMRALERHGAGIMHRAFTGFTALPAPDQVGVGPWYAELGLEPDADLDAAESAYRGLRSVHHPDHGGDADTFHRIQRAIDQARAELGG